MMDDRDRRFERAAAWTAIAGIAIGALSGLLLFLAGDEVVGRVGLLRLVERQSLILDAGPQAAELLRWAYLADMLGYYLLLAPLMLALDGRVARELGRGAARLATTSGLLYVGIGSIGAVLLATLIPDLLRTGGSDPERAAAEVASRALIEGVHRGLWQTLEIIPAGTWLILVGTAYRRAGRPLLGWGGIVSGGFAFLGAAGWFLEAPVMVMVGLAFLLPLLLWIAGVARDLLRDRPSLGSTPPASAT